MDISIIITSYNYDQYIQEAIDSCLEQRTRFKYEVIVIDDGSSDKTRKILSKYSKYCTIIFLENSGVEIASNFGITKSNASFLLRLDADDSLKEDFIEKLYPVIQHSDAAFAFSNYDLIDESSRIIKPITLPSYSHREIFQRGDFLASGTILNKKTFHKIGGYNEKNKNCGLENYEIILKFLSNGYEGVFLEENLFNYRLHSSNMSKERRSNIIDYGQKLFKKEGYGEYSTNDNHPYGLKLS